MYIIWDPTYWLILIGILISAVASWRLHSIYKKYSRIASTCHMTGEQMARWLLNAYGLTNVKIERVSGTLTDHYDPRTNVVRLSDGVYNSYSVAAIGVAAHECGHAIQHAKNYAPLAIRSALVPVANFGSQISWILILLGLLFSSTTGTILLYIGIACFSLAVLFQIVTLPVEFNASGRAVNNLAQMMPEHELADVKKVLSAAALTYVASALSSILQLGRLILIAGRRND